jgi:hypothetical protein
VLLQWRRGSAQVHERSKWRWIRWTASLLPPPLLPPPAINAASMRLCVGELVLHCASCRFHFYLPWTTFQFTLHTSRTDAKQSRIFFPGLLNSYLDACMKKAKNFIRGNCRRRKQFLTTMSLAIPLPYGMSRLLHQHQHAVCSSVYAIDVQKARGPLARHEARIFSTTRAQSGTE